MNGRSRALLIAAGLIVADQLSKLVATSWAAAGVSDQTASRDGVLSIVPVENGGALGGLVVDRPDLLPAVAVAALVLLLALSRRWTAGSTLGGALAVAGAAGNLIDRVRVGHVIDFLAVELGPAQVIFNLADVALFVGVPMLVIATRGANGESRAAGMGKQPDSPVPLTGDPVVTKVGVTIQ